ncbi:MAG: hypothetical protein E6929_11540 [Clostridium sp.]|nr:hypothetical protein [Clostridium sp.]
MANKFFKIFKKYSWIFILLIAFGITMIYKSEILLYLNSIIFNPSTSFFILILSGCAIEILEYPIVLVLYIFSIIFIILGSIYKRHFKNTTDSKYKKKYCLISICMFIIGILGIPVSTFIILFLFAIQ